MYMRRVASPWWWLARPELTKAETGPCLQSTCIIRSDAYACVIIMGSLPVPSEKTSPLHSPNSFLGCGQPAPPLQRWRLRNATLKQEGNDFSHRETCPQFGSAGNQHCIDWGCGGATRRPWRGRFFRSGRTRARWCCIAVSSCVRV